MPNFKAVIRSINKRRLTPDDRDDQKTCPRNAECLLNGMCLSKNIVYQATVTSKGKRESYVCLTSTIFMARLVHRKELFWKVNIIRTLKDQSKEYNTNNVGSPVGATVLEREQKV